MNTGIWRFSWIFVTVGLLVGQADAKYNSIRMALHLDTLPLPDNYLLRAKAAGYTHISASIGGFKSTEWENGLYIGGETGLTLPISEAYKKCHQYGLRFVPQLPSANIWTTFWSKANNPEITYQPYSEDIIGNIVENEVADNDQLLELISKLSGKRKPSENIALSDIPAYAYNPLGLDKTYRSLVRDVIVKAFAMSGLPDSEFDLIQLANDEPCKYGSSLRYSQKLLIGKSQEDLKWMYENDPIDHYGVERDSIPKTPLIPINLSDPLWAQYWHAGAGVYSDHFKLVTLSKDEGKMRTRAYNDYVYYYDEDDSLYRHGLQALIAEYYRRRVQDVAEFAPNVKSIFYGDLFDPQHLGGYFKVADALGMLGKKEICSRGNAANHGKINNYALALPEYFYT